VTSPQLLLAPQTFEGGLLLVLAIILPVTAALLALLFGHWAERIALAYMPVGIAVAFAIARDVVHSNSVVTYYLGGWAPPLGVALRADGFSALMLATTALIIAAAGLFARGTFGSSEGRKPFAFWTLLLALWAALNCVFLGGDLFNLYVALELLTFAAVPLVCLYGSKETLQAATRYLLFALFGSVLYLLGVALLYGAYGTLDIVLLSQRIKPELALWLAAALMTTGLAAKTALFPFHLWLPPAHAGAPPAASAILSALVVKGSFFLCVRLWFNVLPALPSVEALQVVAALGAAAILYGSLLALRQPRLKLLIAYSTVAQIGYLFLLFPLAAGGAPWSTAAWTGGLLQAVSHAFAKASMFLAAGLIAETLGHDRIAEMRGVGRLLPVTVTAFALGGLSLMGLPPSGGFAAKWLLMAASVESGQWVWAAIMLLGGLLAGGYVLRVVLPALTAPDIALTAKTMPSRTREGAVLALALVAVLIGFAPRCFLDWLQIGRPLLALVGTP